MKIPGIRHVFGAAVLLLVSLFAPGVSAQYYPFPYLEAECTDTATGGYVTKQTSIAGASGGSYLRSAANTTPTSYNNTSADHATFKFTTKLPANYVVWFRVNNNNSGGDDSFFFQLDAATFPVWLTVNNMTVSSGWQWIGVETAVFPLGAGSHTLEIANREDGLNIDKIAILPYGQAAPSGLGSQAYNCPVPMYFETECRTGAFAGYQLDKTAKTGFSGSGYIESATTTMDTTTRVDEATYFFETGAGAYNFFFRIHNNQNTANDSWFYRVDNGSWVTMNNTNGLGTGWRWSQGATGATLTHGVHTLRIRNRESGLSIDKLAFVPASATGPSGTSAGSAAVNCEPFQTMSAWSYAETQEYYNTHLNYFAAGGEHMLEHHITWHADNGPGGTRGAGSGVAFLGFHRAMMNDFRRFALETNSRSWLPINPVGPVIPFGLDDAYDALFASNSLAAYSSRVDSSVADWGIPAYLTANGTVNANWQTTVMVGTTTYAKLGDYPDLDSLGQAICVQYHGSLHDGIGGTMSGFSSPADPIFFGWHGLIDQLATAWLATTKGKAWAAANADHPFLKTGFYDMHGPWNNTDWD